MDEYISREEVMSIIANMQEEHHYDAANLEDRYVVAQLLEVADKIKELKAADVQPVNQWVKLHDKNPSTEGFYLVCDQYGKCEVAEYIPDIKSWVTRKIGEIRYWMPLPEPPTND